MPSVDIRAELAKITKVKETKYADRQDYLAAIARSVAKLGTNDYDGLTDEAVDWHNRAVTAMNDRQDIPEFEEDPENDEPIEDTAEAAADEPADEEQADEAGEDDVEDVEDEPEPEPEAEKAEPEPEPEPVKAAKPRGRPKKVKAEPVEEAHVEPAGDAEEPKSKRKNNIRYTDLSGEKDKFGLVAGTKVSKAIALFEQGASASEVNDKIGGRYYNAIHALAEAGHLLEKMPNNVLKLTHKDDVETQKARKK